MTCSVGGPLPWVLQRDTVHTLQRFVKTDTSKVARAGWTLAEDFWRLLYRSAHSLAPATSGRQQVLAPTKAPLQPGGGPPGACFRCGFYGHWARDCDRGVPAFGPQPSQASQVARRLAQNIVVPCGAPMVFRSDFSSSGMFGCHVARPHMVGIFFVRFLGAWKFLGEFSPPKSPPMSGPTPGPFRLPHGVWKRLLGGPGVNFYFAFYDQMTRHPNRCCCRPACPVFKTACVTTTQTCFPF